MPLLTHQLNLGKAYTPDAGVPERTASALAALWALLEAPGLTLPHRRHLLGIAIWKYTEAPGVRPHPKYRLPFRTLGAMDVASLAEVQHEHVWPRKWIIDRLLPKHRAGWSPDDLAEFMTHHHGIACTVTRSEHLLLNASGGAEGWSRYAQAGLQVWDAANERPLELPALQVSATAADVRCADLTTVRGSGVVSQVILDVLALNEKRATPFIRAFLTGADAENIDLVPKYDAAGSATTYIRLFDAELEEPTPVAAYINFNGNLDFHIKPEQIPDLISLEGVHPWKANYVRITLTSPHRVNSALRLLASTLEEIREA
jgi:hypothetical protein